MAQSLDYRIIIKNILNEYIQISPANGEIATYSSFDEEHGNYVLLQAGWNGSKYIHGAFVHIQLTNDKIWIHYDGTEYGIANDLVDAGIPKSSIVLGFRHPFMRPYTEFAVA